MKSILLLGDINDEDLHLIKHNILEYFQYNYNYSELSNHIFDFVEQNYSFHVTNQNDPPIVLLKDPILNTQTLIFIFTFNNPSTFDFLIDNYKQNIDDSKAQNRYLVGIFSSEDQKAKIDQKKIDNMKKELKCKIYIEKNIGEKSSFLETIEKNYEKEIKESINQIIELKDNENNFDVKTENYNFSLKVAYQLTNEKKANIVKFEIQAAQDLSEIDITIPASIKYESTTYPIVKICDGAFSNAKINSLSFSDDSCIEFIGNYVFENSDIKKITFPSKLKEIGASWSKGAIKLEAINGKNEYLVKDTSKNIVYFKRNDNKKLAVFTRLINTTNTQKSIKLSKSSDSLKSKKALLRPSLSKRDNPDLSINSNKNDHEIGFMNYAFYNNSKIVSVTVKCNQNSYFSIGDGCFENCINLSDLDFNGKAKFGSNVFKSCRKDFKIKGTIFEFDDNCFCEFRSKKLKIEAESAIFNDFCFLNCGLTHLTILCDKIEIGYKCFYNCSSLESFTIENSNSVNIQANAFLRCDKLKSVSIKANEKILFNESCFKSLILLNELNIDCKVIEFGCSCFSECKALKTLKLSNIVYSKVYFKSFYGCESLVDLKEINISHAESEFMSSYFDEIGNNIIKSKTTKESFETRLLKNFEELILLLISENNYFKYPAGFGYFDDSKKVIILNMTEKNSNGIIYSYPFIKSEDDDNEITKIIGYEQSEIRGNLNIPSKIEREIKIISINEGAFSKSKITSLSFDDDSYVTIIGNFAFENSKIEELVLPKSLEELSENWCAKTPNLISIKSKNDKFSLDSSRFLIEKDKLSQCHVYFAPRKLNGKSCPKYIIARSIKSHAFEYCQWLTDLKIKNETAIDIGNYSFSNAKNLKKITIECNNLKIGSECFKDCDNLEYIYITVNINNYNNVSRAEFALLCFNKLKCLKFVNIDSNIIIFNDKCFNECLKLSKINIKNLSYVKFGNNPFNNCNNLKFQIIGLSKEFNVSHYFSKQENPKIKYLLTQGNEKNKKYVGKMYKSEEINSEKFISFFNNNNKLFQLTKLTNSNISPLPGFGLINNSLFTVRDWYEYTLETELEKGTLTQLQRYNILVGIANGIEYLHSKNIFHNNLSPSKILLRSNFCPLITEYEVSNQYKNLNKSCYMPPEFLLNNLRIPEKFDVYSFAIIAYELLTGKKPFVKCTDFNQLKNALIQMMRPETSSISNESNRVLIEECWSNDPSKRPTFKEILERLNTEEFKEDFERYQMNEKENKAEKATLGQLNLLLYEKAKTATIVYSPNYVNNPLQIPNAIEYKDEKYKITSIADGAFVGNSSTFIHLLFDDGTLLESIGDFAFKNSFVDEIKASKSIPKLSPNWCAGANKLRNVSFNSNYYVTDDNYVVLCKNEIIFVPRTYSSQDFTIPPDINCIRNYAFENCEVEQILFPNSLCFHLCSYCFSNMKKLVKIFIPSRYITLEEGCLQGCSSIEEISLPNVYEIKFEQYFCDCCEKLKKVLLPSVESLELSRFCFRNCKLEHLVFPNKLKTMKLFEGCFENCLLESICFDLDKITVYSDAFKGSDKLSQVRLTGGSLFEFKENSFNELKNLNEIYLSSTEIIFENNWIRKCENLKNIFIKCKKDVSISNELKDCTCLEKLEIHSESSVTLLRKSAPNLKEFKELRISAKIVNITDYYFSEIKNLETVEIISSESINIGENSFKNCKKLLKVSFENAKKLTIKSYAFFGCEEISSLDLKCKEQIELLDHCFSRVRKLTKINFDTAKLIMKNSCFSQCSSLKEITIPSSVTEIEDYLFQGCESLERISFESDITSIGNHSFDGCCKLKEITLPKKKKKMEKMEKIGDFAFNKCAALIFKFQFLELKYLGEYAFNECKMIDFIIPKTLSKISKFAFNKCVNLTYMNIPSSIKIIENNAFSGCISLKDVPFNKSVTYIGDYAFSGCRSLSEIRIDSKTESIGNGVFSDCIQLERAVFPESIISVGVFVFSGCNKSLIIQGAPPAIIEKLKASVDDNEI